MRTALFRLNNLSNQFGMGNEVRSSDEAHSKTQALSSSVSFRKLLLSSFLYLSYIQPPYGLSPRPPPFSPFPPTAGSELCAVGTRAGGSPAATKRMPALRTMLFLRL